MSIDIYYYYLYPLLSLLSLLFRLSHLDPLGSAEWRKPLESARCPCGTPVRVRPAALTFSHYIFLHFTLDFTSGTHFFALTLLFHFGLHFLQLLSQRSSPGGGVFPGVGSRKELG